MEPVKLEAELHFGTANGRQVVSLVLRTEDEQAMETLMSMAWGRLDDVGGMQYCHVNTVYPHTIGGDGKGGVELVMTVNHNPWTREDTPSHSHS